MNYTCHNCKSALTQKNVNILAYFGVKMRSFCNNCYASTERGYIKRMFYVPRRSPLNSGRFYLSLFGVTATFVFFILFGLLKNEPFSSSYPIFWPMAGFIAFVNIWYWSMFIFSRAIIKKLPGA